MVSLSLSRPFSPLSKYGYSYSYSLVSLYLIDYFHGGKLVRQLAVGSWQFGFLLISDFELQSDRTNDGYVGNLL